MEIKGCILVRKLDQRDGIGQRSGLKWVSADYLIEVPGQYVRHARMTVRKEDLIKRFDQLIGKNVNVSFDINAQEYKDRWINELVAWGIMEYVTEYRTPVTTVAQTQYVGTESAPAAAAAEPGTGDTPQQSNDGLPF